MSNKMSLRFTILCILATVTSSTVYAEALLTEPLDNNITTHKKQPRPIGTAVTGAGNVTPIVRSGDAPQIMSCWQFGNLLIEQPVVAPKEKSADTRTIHNPQTGKDMLAIDFKNAFCFIR